VKPDYTAALRIRAARWTVIYMLLVAAWIAGLSFSLATVNAIPVLVATVLFLLCYTHERIGSKYLQDAQENARDEQLIQMLRESMRSRGEL
jgi:hypothetical protein